MTGAHAALCNIWLELCVCVRGGGGRLGGGVGGGWVGGVGCGGVGGGGVGGWGGLRSEMGHSTYFAAPRYQNLTKLALAILSYIIFVSATSDMNADL